MNLAEFYALILITAGLLFVCHLFAWLEREHIDAELERLIENEGRGW